MVQPDSPIPVTGEPRCPTLFAAKKPRAEDHLLISHSADDCRGGDTAAMVAGGKDLRGLAVAREARAHFLPLSSFFHISLMKYALCVAFTPPNCLTRFSARCRASPATSSSGGGARCLGGFRSVWATPPCLLTLSSLRCNARPASSGGERERLRLSSRSVCRTPP